MGDGDGGCAWRAYVAVPVYETRPWSFSAGEARIISGSSEVAATAALRFHGSQAVACAVWLVEADGAAQLVGVAPARWLLETLGLVPKSLISFCAGNGCRRRAIDACEALSQADGALFLGSLSNDCRHN